jgi:hypothetical protein
MSIDRRFLFLCLSKPQFSDRRRDSFNSHLIIAWPEYSGCTSLTNPKPILVIENMFNIFSRLRKDVTRLLLAFRLHVEVGQKLCTILPTFGNAEMETCLLPAQSS